MSGGNNLHRSIEHACLGQHRCYQPFISYCQTLLFPCIVFITCFFSQFQDQCHGSVVCCLLFVVCCLLFVVCCLLFVVCCMLFVVCCLLFVVVCSTPALSLLLLYWFRCCCRCRTVVVATVWVLFPRVSIVIFCQSV
jgi:hypothetical protein